MDINSARSFSVADCFVIFLITLCISTALYHPFYFGDELFSFAFRVHHQGAFAFTLAELNDYKPRVLMNLIWAAIATLDAPRWVPMLINAVSMAACAILVYAFGRRVFAASRAASLLAAIVLLATRFGVMLYYDYVSGIVETMSLAFFLGGLYLSAEAVFGYAAVSRARFGASLLCFVLTVLIHERFLAGLAALMGVVCLFQLKQEWLSRGWKCLAFPVVSVMLPLLLVVVLVETVSSHPLTMGTSGQTVRVSEETFYVAWTYLQNVLLGSNFGPSWFVGLLNQDSALSGITFRIFGVVFGLAWLLPWISKRRLGVAMGSSANPRYQAIAVLLAFVVGMVLIASLPGANRQEARWMFPVFSAVLLLILATYQGLARHLLLMLMLICQVFYLWFGSVDEIASIRASKAARELGRVMETVDFPGDAGILMNAPEPDTSWVLGGADGHVFCQVNMPSRDCLRSMEAYKDRQQLSYGFGLVLEGKNRRGDWNYRYVTRPVVTAELDPTSLPESGDFFGNDDNWQGWTFDKVTKKTSTGIELSGLAENFYRADVRRLDGKILVYRAEAIYGDAVPMRIQVNWHTTAGQFLFAYVKVVNVSGPLKNYSAIITAPDAAAYGQVYATLHDGAQGKVRLKSIRVVDVSTSGAAAIGSRD